MKPLAAFGTKAHPIHPSGLRNIIVCPWRAVLEYLSDAHDEGGSAADTGSAMHRAAEAVHKEGASIAEAISIMAANKHLYPLADLEDAAKLFLGYAAFPATSASTVVKCEEKFTFTISPAPEDHTQEAIEIEGELDQVRRYSEDNRLRMWDIKTSKRQPVDVMRDSMHQVALYCIGASMLMNEKVYPGGVIMPRQKNMFIPFSWTWDDIEELVNPIRRTVAAIRAGKVDAVPGAETCKWCPANGPELCLPRKRRTLKALL